MALRAVSDPELLEQLNAQPASASPRLKPVSDPAILQQLDAGEGRPKMASRDPNEIDPRTGKTRAQLEAELKQNEQLSQQANAKAALLRPVGEFARGTGRSLTNMAKGILYIPGMAESAIMTPASALAGREIKGPVAMAKEGLSPAELQPRGRLEEVAGTIEEGVGGVLGGGALGQGLTRAASPVARRVGTVLQEKLGAQTVAAGTAGLAAEGAKEAGAGTAGQTAAGLAGSLVPFAGPATAAALSRRATAVPKAAKTAEDVLSRMNMQQSVGAAAAAPDLARASPELRAAIVENARKSGGAVNPAVLARHLDADTLPVPIRLTEGQATQEPGLISGEMNLRGRRPEMVEHYNQQNKALGENMRVLRDQAGPDVFTTNEVEHGDALIGAYRAKNEAAKVQIDAKYKALRDAAGGDLPIDTQALWGNASAKLKKQLLFEHAPKSIMVQLKAMEKSGMNFEQFEALRTNLATLQRSHTTGGLERSAAGIIRQALEDMPLQPRAAGLKALADDARQSARAQFKALEDDPAYAAAVEDRVPAEKFVKKFVIHAPRTQLERMRGNFADDPVSQQTMNVSVLDHLRDQARLNPSYEGNFAADSYNKALKQLDPKLKLILPENFIEPLTKLGNVSRYIATQPKGSFVNNSNTFVAGAANYGGGALEGVANVAAGGVPVGTWARKAMEAGSAGRKARRSIAPGAGLNRLATLEAAPVARNAPTLPEPVAGSVPASPANRTAQLAPQEDPFVTERAAAAESARGGYEVAELPAQEIVMQTPRRQAAKSAVAMRSDSRNALAQLEPRGKNLFESARAAARDEVTIKPDKDGYTVRVRGQPSATFATLGRAREEADAIKQAIESGTFPQSAEFVPQAKAEKTPADIQREIMAKTTTPNTAPRSAEQIKADLAKLDAKAQRLPENMDFDDPKMKAIEAEYARLNQELKRVQAAPKREVKPSPTEAQMERTVDKRRRLPEPAEEFSPARTISDASPEAARMERARALGFRERRSYHGTASDIDAFSLDQPQVIESPVGRLGVSVSDDPDVAAEFAQTAASKNRSSTTGANTVPVRIRGSKQGEIELEGNETNLEIAATVEDAWNAGYDLIKFTNYTTPGGLKGKSFILVRDPSQIRSVHAKFDPKKKGSANLLAGLAGVGVGAQLLAPKKQENNRIEQLRGAR